MRSEVSYHSATAGSPCRGLDPSDIDIFVGLMDQMWWLGLLCGAALGLLLPCVLDLARWLVGVMIRAHGVIAGKEPAR